MALVFAAGAASAQTRTLKLYFIHTKERAEITYKRNGRYIPSAMNEINRFLRDWRRNEPTKMDPRVVDLLWEVYQAVGGRDYIHIVSAYRSPATNAMLRSRSKGVAKKSQHMLGKAIDFYIPGVPLAKLRAAGFKAQGGGVGYYPTSGSPFVHLDVGSVRSWPRMSRKELVALFPDGKTAHIPADGKPLAGYSQTVAALKAGKNVSTIQVASAGDAKPRRGLLSVLFGGGADEEEDVAENGGRVTPQQPVVASAALAPAPEPAQDTPETILAALAPTSIPIPHSAPRVVADTGQALALAQAEAETRDTTQAALDAAAALLADSPSEEPVEIAANIPLPTQRPDYSPGPVDTEVQLADAATPGVPGPAGPDSDEFDAKADADSGPSATVAAYLPLPSRRPDGNGSPEYVLASLPNGGPSYSAPPIAGEAKDAIASGSTSAERTDRRLARLGSAPAASQRQALISNSAQGPDAAIATGVRTTEKGAKPHAGDSRRDPRAVLVPIPTQVARWALNPAPTRMEKRGTRAPSFEIAHLRSAPQVVYTAGFESGGRTQNSERFAGKAVTFLSVARFRTN